MKFKTIIKNRHCQKCILGDLSTGQGVERFLFSGGIKIPLKSQFRADEKILFGPSMVSGGMFPRTILKMEPLRLAKILHFLPVVKITLPVLICTDVLTLDVQFLSNLHSFLRQKIKVGLGILKLKFGGLKPSPKPLCYYDHKVS